MHQAEIRALRRSVLRWAATHARPLPWRGERDPYRVLVSEVMLQQTQASRVVAAFGRFLGRFPTVESLAAARSANVLRVWGDLGYTRRALNLWRAARAIVDNGFPTTSDELQALPGVGPYTARAVAVFAFGEAAGAVDANVRRVLTRVTGIPPDAEVQHLADALVPRGSSASWTQALFDLGADVCKPRRPSCAACPIRARCAWASGHRPAPVRPRGRSPRFETTNRYARGRVVDALRSRSSTPTELVRRTGLEAGRVEDAVKSLVRDGLIERRGRRIRLGVSERASGGRRRPLRGSADRRA